MASVELNTKTVAETLGAVQLGVLFNSFLFGILFMQWVTYFTSKFNDGWPIRALVYWIMLLDVVHVGISWEYLWMYTVDHFGDYATLFGSHWQYNCGPIFIVLTAAPTQFFLVNRTHKMLGHAHRRIANGVLAFTCVLSLTQVILGMYMAFKLLIVGVTTTEGYKKFVAVSVAWEAVAITTDMTVMVSLIATLLYRRTGFKQTDWMVFNLILVAIECAVPVTLFTIGHMTGVIASPTTAIHQLFAWSQARLYSNTLFVNLNARSKLRKAQGGVHTEGSMSATSNAREVNFLKMDRSITSRQITRPQVHIEVTQEDHFVMDPISTKGIEERDYKPLAV